MKKRAFGNNRLEVPGLGFGCMTQSFSYCPGPDTQPAAQLISPQGDCYPAHLAARAGK